jgi:hypothetical protein
MILLINYIQYMDILKQDISLFSYDLQEYKNSIQGKKVSKLLKKDISYSNTKYAKQLEDALDDYWYHRNTTEFTYTSPQDKKEGQYWDKETAQMYKEQD